MIDLRNITVEDILSQTTVEQGIEMYHRTNRIPSNSEEPWQGFIPPLGTWRLDPVIGEWEILIEIPSDQIEPSEKDWEGIRRHWTYLLYRHWSEKGYQAPPVVAIRVLWRDDEKLCSLNRRRVLVAWDTNQPTVLAWFSETDQWGKALWTTNTKEL